MTTANTNLVAHAVATAAEATALFFQTVASLLAFMVAGDARFTILSEESGQRFTYHVELKEDATDFGFVSVFTGNQNDNDSHYDYIGYVRRDRKGRWWFNYGTRSIWLETDPRVVAFAWTFRRAARAIELPAAVKVWHDGRCGRCARTLTSEYRLVGIGPVCCGHLDLDPIRLFAALPVSGAIEAARAALAAGRNSDARKIAAAHKSPLVGQYIADHLGAERDVA